MRFNITPATLLALVVGLATGALAFGLGLPLLGTTWDVWLVLGCITLGVSVCTWVAVRLLIVSRLNALYSRLLAFRRRRLPDSSVSQHPDPIQGLGRTIVELTGTMRQELAEMREAEVVRREFIGDVSHELKTPIFAIQGFIETLLDGALEDPAVNRKFLEKALNNAMRLNNLVQDLLMVTQLEAGQMQMDIHPFRIYELVLDVVDSIYQKTEAAGLQVQPIQVKCNIPERTYVLADRNRVFQVLTNLLDNAMRYGNPNGKVCVALEPCRTETGEKLCITVQDDGPGIPEADLPHIFNRFYRVEKSRARNLGGNGLGLAIVRNLVEAHGETITVTSKPGDTRFRFTLAPSEG
jgi:two-component system phosphate regulon sensor histidine kinase PhoR